MSERATVPPGNILGINEVKIISEYERNGNPEKIFKNPIRLTCPACPEFR